MVRLRGLRRTRSRSAERIVSSIVVLPAGSARATGAARPETASTTAPRTAERADMPAIVTDSARVNRRARAGTAPRLELHGSNASPEEAAAVMAAIEQFLRDTAPAPAAGLGRAEPVGAAPRDWRASSALRCASPGRGNRPARRPHLPAGRFPPSPPRPRKRPQDARGATLRAQTTPSRRTCGQFPLRQGLSRTGTQP